jgi:hypothetical protein
MNNHKIWRAIPLKAIMPTSRLLDDLSCAGYETAGDILDVEPNDLVRDVKGVGLTRAIEIRQKVFNAVKPPQLVIPDDYKPTTPAFWDIVLTVGSLTAVGILFACIAAWLL